VNENSAPTPKPWVVVVCVSVLALTNLRTETVPSGEVAGIESVLVPTGCFGW
jgi:hypothetical protein